jgi:hypothetical protein
LLHEFLHELLSAPGTPLPLPQTSVLSISFLLLQSHLTLFVSRFLQTDEKGRNRKLERLHGTQRVITKGL